MHKVKESDVVTLNRMSGELTFTHDDDVELELDELVEYQGIGFKVNKVGASIARAEAPALAAVTGHEPFALTLSPGDVLVFRVDREITSTPMHQMIDTVARLLPGYRAMVLSGVDVAQIDETHPANDALAVLQWLENEVEAGDEAVVVHRDRMRRVLDSLIPTSGDAA